MPARPITRQSRPGDENRNDQDETFVHPIGNIDDYSVSTRVGRGKYSNVFRGKNKNGSLCVVKVLKPVRISKINREIAILEHLRGGPNISQLFDVVLDTDSKSIALILDWSENVNIRTIFDRLTIENIAIYTYKVLKALEFAHAKGIMHRDIKPGNIMYSPDTNELKVIDWGLAEFYRPNTNYQVRVATKNYKGPELLLNYPQYDYSLDIWCLGCTFASLLFQKTPFFKSGDNTDEQVAKLGQILGGDKILAYANKYHLELSEKLRAELSKYRKKSFADFRSNYERKRNLELPSEALDLLSQMLEIDHAERPTATEALAHPFFNRIRHLV